MHIRIYAVQVGESAAATTKKRSRCMHKAQDDRSSCQCRQAGGGQQSTVYSLSPKSPMPLAFSAQGFQTTASGNPVFSITMRCPAPWSSICKPHQLPSVGPLAACCSCDGVLPTTKASLHCQARCLINTCCSSGGQMRQQAARLALAVGMAAWLLHAACPCKAWPWLQARC